MRMTARILVLAMLWTVGACGDSDDAQPADVITEDTSSAPGCAPLTLSGQLEAFQQGVFALRMPIAGVGSDKTDVLAFEFITNETGAFDLASPVNGNYGTCKQCLRLLEDVGETAPDPNKPKYFQTSGRITVHDSTAPLAGDQLTVTVHNLTLAEADLGTDDDFTSTLIDGGACFTVDGPVTLSTPPCPTACEGRVCGRDGCDGECGGGCADGLACSLDGSACQAPDAACQVVNLSSTLTYDPVFEEFVGEVTGPALGAVGVAERVQIELYAPISGRFDLTVDGNENYAICNQCVRFFVDQGDGQREFFQSAGTMEIRESSDIAAGQLQVTLIDVELEEVVLDRTTFESTPVEGGACLSLGSSLTLSTGAR